MDGQKFEDLKHVGKSNYINIGKDTGYWFKRDLGTMRRSAVSTFKFLPLIILVTFIGISVLDSVYGSWNLKVAINESIIMVPIMSLAYWMIHVMRTKGYSINPRLFNGGTRV